MSPPVDPAPLFSRPIAHRGLHDGNVECVENSLTSFVRACDGGFAIELDVQLSADDQAMVFHDSTLERLTAFDGAVRTYDTEELGGMKLLETDDVILPLRAILGAVDGQVPVIVEMKDNGVDNDVLARAVAEDLAAYGQPSAAMSFAPDLVEEFARLCPQMPAGLTAEGTSERMLAQNQAAMGPHISFVSYNVLHLPNAFATHVREELNMPVICWTVRTPQMWDQAKGFVDQMTFEGFDPDSPD